VSFYEADAFARWAGHRLPTEFEWEAASANETATSSFDLSRLNAKPASAGGESHFSGNVWQWTGSAYLPYPGYKPAPGPLGEYMEVHVQPARAARRIVRHAGSPPALELSQLLLSASTLAVHGPAPGERRLMMQKLASAECATQTASSDFLEAVLEGLSLPQKALPSRFFYDEAGSALFERITALPEYYPTRTEIALLNSYGGGIGESVRPGHGRGIRLGLQPQDRAAAESAPPPSRLHPHRHIAFRALSSGAAHSADVSGHRCASVLGSFGDLGEMQLPAGAILALAFSQAPRLANLTPNEAVSFLRCARRYLAPMPISSSVPTAKAARYSATGL